MWKKLKSGIVWIKELLDKFMFSEMPLRNAAPPLRCHQSSTFNMDVEETYRDILQLRIMPMHNEPIVKENQNVQHVYESLDVLLADN